MKQKCHSNIPLSDCKLTLNHGHTTRKHKHYSLLEGYHVKLSPGKQNESCLSNIQQTPLPGPLASCQPLGVANYKVPSTTAWLRAQLVR